MKQILFVVTASLLFNFAHGQRDLPFMYVPTKISKKQVSAFDSSFKTGRKSKHKVFDMAVNGKHPLNYRFSLSAIDTLIARIGRDNLAYSGNGFRMLFGAYDTSAAAKPSFSIDNVKDGQVLLFFCGSRGDRDANLQNYYFIPPSGTTVENLPVPIRDYWIAKYFNKINNDDGLLSTIDTITEDNQTRRNNQYMLSDTRSLYYSAYDFVDYLSIERAYQDSIATRHRGIPIDEMEIDFAAYSKAGIPYGEGSKIKARFKGRMIVQYEFLRKGVKVNIAKSPGFGQRKRKPSVTGKNFAGDNGQLCPSQCPPGETK